MPSRARARPEGRDRAKPTPPANHPPTQRAGGGDTAGPEPRRKLSARGRAGPAGPHTPGHGDAQRPQGPRRPRARRRPRGGGAPADAARKHGPQRPQTGRRRGGEPRGQPLADQQRVPRPSYEAFRIELPLNQKCMRSTLSPFPGLVCPLSCVFSIPLHGLFLRVPTRPGGRNFGVST